MLNDQKQINVYILCKYSNFARVSHFHLWSLCVVGITPPPRFKFINCSNTFN